MGLELYAKIEPLLGFEEEIDRLHGYYIDLLRPWEPKTLIDIGCGSGRFLTRAREELSLERAYGVDLSETMVKEAVGRGVEADAVDVCDATGRFDVATAVFDVLNYLPESALERFFDCVARRLAPGGIFLADINTAYGFEEVAQGALVHAADDRFLALDASYDGKALHTAIDYFETDAEGCYRRERDTIVQYHHPIETFAGMKALELVQSYPLAMYGEEPDKELLLFKKP